MKARVARPRRVRSMCSIKFHDDGCQNLANRDEREQDLRKRGKTPLREGFPIFLAQVLLLLFRNDTARGASKNLCYAFTAN